MPAEGGKFFSAARGARWNACGMEGERKICVARGTEGVLARFTLRVWAYKRGVDGDYSFAQ